jgi:hypothetical protein
MLLISHHTGGRHERLYEHHKNSIQFGYRCFDRLLLNGLIQPFQQPERVLGFFNAYREGKRVTKKLLTGIADQFQYWLKNRSEKWGAPILEPPDGTGDGSRRDKLLDPYFETAEPGQVVAIVKAREPARILAAIGDKNNDSPHLEFKLGQPKKITMIFGRKVTKEYKGKLQTVIEDLDPPNPVIRSHYGHGFAKQYVRDDRILRTEPATNNVYDYGFKKDVENLPQLRDRMSEIVDNYHNVQQDVLETFVDRGQLRKLAEPTVLPRGKRIPGLKLDHPRQLAVMHSLVRFANIAAGGSFTTADLYTPALDALGQTEAQYSLASFRYDLSKLRHKGLVEKVPHSRRYRLVGKGYSICLVFLKLFEKIYAPLTAGLLAPFRGDRILADEKRCQLDRLYQRICDSLDAVLREVGLKIAA